MLKRMLLIGIVVIAIVALATAAAAQGNGNGGRGGNGGPGGNTDTGQTQAANPGGMGNNQMQLHHQQQNNIGANCTGTCDPLAQNQYGYMYRHQLETGAGPFAMLPPATVDELPADIEALVVSGWQDEVNAIATYEAIIAAFGDNPPFSNILAAEQQHASAWEFMFERYGIETPEPAAFAAPEFASLTEACQAAVDAEVANFGLYDTMLAAFETYPDLYQVALALRNASEFNHLPAFERCAGR